MPPCRSARSSTQRIEASSSTSQTLSAFVCFIGVLNGSRMVKMVLARAAVEFDQAVVTADQVLRDGKPEPGALGAAGDQRIEQGVAQLGGTPGPLSSNWMLATRR